MTKDEALKLALEFIENSECGTADLEARIKKALAQPEPIQVTVKDFVSAVEGKENLIGHPIYWAQWPNQEKNT